MKKIKEELVIDLPNKELIKRFNELADIVDLRNSCDMVKISEMEEYKEIINMGNIVIPLILERFKTRWEIALIKLTGINTKKTYDMNYRMDFWKNYKYNG